MEGVQVVQVVGKATGGNKTNLTLPETNILLIAADPANQLIGSRFYTPQVVQCGYLPSTVAPEKMGWLEYDWFLLRPGLFSEANC